MTEPVMTTRRRRRLRIQGLVTEYLHKAVDNETMGWVSLYTIVKWLQDEASGKPQLTAQSLSMLLATLVKNGVLERETIFVSNTRDPSYRIAQCNDSPVSEEE